MITVGSSNVIPVSFYSAEEILDVPREALCRLDSKIIVVWGVDLGGSLEGQRRCRLSLSEEERVRADRFTSEENRQRYILAHGSLRALLGLYLNVSPGAVTFQRSVTGKPALFGKGHASDLSFSLSHAHGRAVIALSRGCEVGVDLEKVRADVEVEKLADRYFALSEQAEIMRTTPERRAAAFFRYWVAKEAVLKAQGIGLQGLSQCEIIAGTDCLTATVRVPAGSPLRDHWRIRYLSCGEGWEAAVAAEGVDWVVQSGVIR